MADQMDEIRQRVAKIHKRRDKANDDRSRLNGILDTKKQELAALVAEITEAGYDPKRLKETRDIALAELQTACEQSEKDLDVVEESIRQYTEKRG